MANKKNKDEETKKTSSKKNTTKSTNKSSTVKNASKAANTKKDTSSKSTVNKKNVKKTSVGTKKTNNKKSTVKTTKKIEDKKMPEDVIIEENVINLEEKIEFPNNYVNTEDNNISDQEKDEKIIVEEINNITKLEDAKFVKEKKKRSLLPIGVIISIRGLVALFISLVANRIVDREFLSDSSITIMLIISIIIEGFGAFIIINES